MCLLLCHGMLCFNPFVCCFFLMGEISKKRERNFLSAESLELTVIRNILFNYCVSPLQNQHTDLTTWLRWMDSLSIQVSAEAQLRALQKNKWRQQYAFLRDVFQMLTMKQN